MELADYGLPDEQNPKPVIRGGLHIDPGHIVESQTPDDGWETLYFPE